MRRSRDRFWRPFGDGALADADKSDAYDTLHTVLEVLAKTSAPLLPFLSESVYRGLTGERSVHLADWPDAAELPEDRQLVAAMDLVREACSAIHSVRKQKGRRARLPLPSVTIAHPDSAALEPFVSLIADEANVKSVVLEADAAQRATTSLVVVPAAIGPRLGELTQKVIAAVRRGEWRLAENGAVEVAGVTLGDGEYELRVVPSDPDVGRVIDEGRGVVVVDTEVTPELEAEGTVRDLVRIVQQARRDADFAVGDRIFLGLVVPDDVAAQLATFGDELARQTLAQSLTVSSNESAPPQLPETGTPPVHGQDKLPDGRVVDYYLTRVEAR